MDSGKRRLMVVDDAPARRLEVSSLLSQAGYSVGAVADPKLALSMLTSQQPELVILAAPAGLSLCRAIKQDPAWARLPVVLLGSAASAEQRQQALAAGAEELLAMPLDREAFLDLLDQLLHIRDVGDQLDIGVAPLVEALGPDALGRKGKP